MLAYRKDLEQAQDFVNLSFSIDDLSHCTHPDLRAWIIDLVEQGLSQTTVNRKLATLRSFYKFLMRSKIIQKDPTYKLKSLKSPKKLPEFLQETTIESVLEEGVYAPTFEGQRDRMVLEFLYLTGVRLSELTALKWKDIRLQEEQVKVLGKRQKNESSPWPNHFSEISRTIKMW